MATFYPLELIGISDVSVPTRKLDGRVDMAGLRRRRRTITLASQASGDVCAIVHIPEGAAFAFAVGNTDTSLGTATIAIGVAGTPAKYKAAATFTATDTPTMWGKAAAQALTPNGNAPEAVILTIGAAAFPASGTLVIDIYISER